MNIRRLSLGVGAAAAFALSACGSDSKPATTSTPMASAPSGAPMASVPNSAPIAAGANTVVISDFKFGAAEMRVAVGATVTFTNDDDQPHTATSAGNFDTGAIQPGASATVTLATAGTFSYACSFHPFMTGTLTVA